jgi:translation initiation factor 2-alpha kinase 4
MQLLSALESIHSAHIVHGGIKAKMIFVGSEKGKGKEGAEVGVKLAGVSWYQRLIDLNKSDPWTAINQEEEPPDSW